MIECRVFRRTCFSSKIFSVFRRTCFSQNSVFFVAKCVFRRTSSVFRRTHSVFRRTNCVFRRTIFLINTFYKKQKRQKNDKSSFFFEKYRYSQDERLETLLLRPVPRPIFQKIWLFSPQFFTSDALELVFRQFRPFLKF